MAGTLVLIIVANMANLLTFPVTIIGSRFNYTYCSITNEVITSSNIITILFRAYIPFTLMLVFDVIVFKRLRKSKRRVGVTQIGQRKQPGQFSNKEYNFILSTIFIDLTFVAFYTPVVVYISIQVADLYIDWNRLTSAAFSILYGLAMFLSYLYSVLPLLIFFIFNRYFRNEIFTVLRLNKIFTVLRLNKIFPAINLNQTVMVDTRTSAINMNRMN